MKIQAHKDKNKKTNQETIEDWRRVIKESKTRKNKKAKTQINISRYGVE